MRAYPFYQKQQKIALRNVSLIDPGNIDEYIAFGIHRACQGPGHAGQAGYQEVITSGLRGRGRCRLSHPAPSGRPAARLPEFTPSMWWPTRRGDPDIGMHRSMMKEIPIRCWKG